MENWFDMSGMTIAQVAKVAKALAVANEVDNEVQFQSSPCSDCNRTVSWGSKFCSLCGTSNIHYHSEFDKSDNVCSVVHKEILAESKGQAMTAFCEMCGVNLA